MTVTVTGSKKAVFLDRDGVIVEDRGVLTRPRDVVIVKGAAAALRRLKDAGFLVIVVSNQTAIARGLLQPAEVVALQQAIELRLGGADTTSALKTSATAGASAGTLPSPLIDAFYFCPHHPNATVPTYRRDCTCRKPAPGLLLEAARALDVDLRASVMVGDRPSDVAAGKAAGCRTIQVLTGRHADPLIETSAGFAVIPPDLVCLSIAEAVDRILADHALSIGSSGAPDDEHDTEPLQTGIWTGTPTPTLVTVDPTAGRS